MSQPPPPMQPPAYGQPYGGDPYGGGSPPYGGQPGQYGAPPPPPGQPPGPYGGYPQYGPPAQYSAHGITAPDDTTWATLGYVGQVVIGVIAPLIVYLSRKDRSPFVRYHGAQALNLGLTALIVSFGGIALAFVIGIVTMGIGLIILLPAIIAFSIAQLVYMIIAAIRSNRQEMYQIPTWICWPMVK